VAADVSTRAAAIAHAEQFERVRVLTPAVAALAAPFEGPSA
jgi:hypothetical protein